MRRVAHTTPRRCDACETRVARRGEKWCARCGPWMECVATDAIGRAWRAAEKAR